MEIQINYHETRDFILLENTFKEVLNWTIKKLKLPVTTLDIILTSDVYLKRTENENLVSLSGK